MKLTVRQDIAAPAEAVYAAVTDFELFLGRLNGHGVRILPLDGPEPPEPGAKWQAALGWRGSHYDIDIELVSVEPGTGYALEAHSSGIIGLGVVDLVALSEVRTRLMVSLDFRATSISARFLLSTAVLTRGVFERRLQDAVARYGKEIEEGRATSDGGAA